MSSHSENHSRTNGSACKHPVLRVSHLWKVFKVRSGSSRRTEDLIAMDDVSFSYRDRLPPLHRTGHHFVTRRQQHRLGSAGQATGLG